MQGVPLLSILCFTSTLVVKSHEINACSMFASHVYFQATHPKLNAKDADMEKVLLLYDITTKVLLKPRL